MDLALLWFGFLWAWLGRHRGGGSTTPETSPPMLPTPHGGPEALPPAAPETPWPQVMPTGLPAFPGAGWEYDEPPPSAVQTRARALLSDLWARGRGSWRAEKTGGRWIVYRAEITRGNKRGVVAYRERGTGTRAQAQTAAPRPPVAVPVSTAPAAPAVAPETLSVGRTYRIRGRVVSSTPPLTPDMIDGFRRGIELAGGTAVQVDMGPPIAFAYSMTPQRPVIIPIGKPIALTFGQLSVSVVFVSVDEQITPGAPAPAPGAAPGAAPSQVALPTLRRGAGIRPQPPSADVRLLQGKLGIATDGQFGAGTEQAVKAFQRSKGLTPDGIVGPKTWTALFAAHRA